MKFITFLSLLSFLSFSTFAETKKPLKPISSACNEFVAGKIIDFLENEEPSAELHIIKNEKNEIIGLTDVGDVYPTIDFVLTEKTNQNSYVDNYSYNTTIVYAEYKVALKNGKVSCKIIDIGIAQNDQDQE